MTVVQRWLIPLLLAVIFGLVLYIDAAPSSQTALPLPASNDARTEVVITAAQSEEALGEMRGFVGIIRNAYVSRANGDTNALISNLKQGGPQQQSPVGKSLQSVLPPEFKAMSKAMRSDFATAANEAESGNLAAADAAIARATSQCISCHESYRFVIQ